MAKGCSTRRVRVAVTQRVTGRVEGKRIPKLSRHCFINSSMSHLPRLKPVVLITSRPGSSSSQKRTSREEPSGLGPSSSVKRKRIGQNTGCAHIKSMFPFSSNLIYRTASLQHAWKFFYHLLGAGSTGYFGMQIMLGVTITFHLIITVPTVCPSAL